MVVKQEGAEESFPLSPFIYGVQTPILVVAAAGFEPATKGL